MKAILVAMLLVSLAASGQTAKVIQLSPADADEMKSLYAQRNAINEAINKAREAITDKYLMEEKPGLGAMGGLAYGISGSVLCVNTSGSLSPCREETAEEKKTREEETAKWKAGDKLAHHLERKEGWIAGFEFSEDFKFIVPLSFTITSSCQVTCGCISPAFGGSTNLGYGNLITN